MNSCGLVMMPFFVTFQYSAGNGQAEKMFPNFQGKSMSSAFLLSSSIKFPFDFANIALAEHQCHFKVSLQYLFF